MLSTAMLEGAVARTHWPRSTAWRINSINTVVLPVPGAAPTAYGQRSPFEQAVRVPRSWWASLTPLQASHGMLTPSALHFERHHNGVPVIHPTAHRLMIHGLVERPWVFTLDELQRFPSVSRLAFIECSGNSAIEWRAPTGQTVQQTHGLTSTSEWTGVALKTVLGALGVNPDASWVLAEGGDAAAMTRSLPLAPLLEEALLCYAQNGEPLRPEQGYPLRLLVPGWEGNTCIKWLRRLKLGTAPFMTREETSQYTDLMPDGTARQFTMVTRWPPVGLLVSALPRRSRLRWRNASSRFSKRRTSAHHAT